jgi:hypothetical protein
MAQDLETVLQQFDLDQPSIEFIKEYLRLNNGKIKPITLRWFLPYAYSKCAGIVEELVDNDLAVEAAQNEPTKHPAIEPRGFGRKS